jgi:hypothetical protein
VNVRRGPFLVWGMLIAAAGAFFALAFRPEVRPVGLHPRPDKLRSPTGIICHKILLPDSGQTLVRFRKRRSPLTALEIASGWFTTAPWPKRSEDQEDVSREEPCGNPSRAGCSRFRRADDFGGRQSGSSDHAPEDSRSCERKRVQAGVSLPPRAV